ncbi:MAG TPA: hypothetical protein VMV18_13825 [bacterium]|nr:hypothetical protein [bacterium]
MRRPLLALLATTAALLAAVSCAQPHYHRPSIRIVSPTDGATINSQSLFLTVQVENFTLVPTLTQGIGEPYKGHWHLYADGAPLASVFTTSATISAIPIGTHVFAVELANENETPVSGAPPQFVTVTIPSGAPGVQIVNVNDNQLVNSSSLEMPLTVDNFTLVSPTAGTANVAGTGHYQVHFDSLDSPAFDSDWIPGYTLTGLDPTTQVESGNAIFDVWVALANNDGTLVDPPVFDHRHIIVPTSAPRLTLLSPADGAVVGSSFTIALSTVNFTLVDFSGSPADSAGQGHYHVLVDSSDLGPAFQNTSSGWTAGGSGAHRVRVELRSNTDQPLSTTVAARARVTVP